MPVTHNPRKIRLHARNGLYLILLWLFLLASTIAIAQQGNDKPRYLDTRLSIEERVNDLVSRMTLEEKASQMQEVTARWGRGQETYGEDPFLTGRMAVAFITGLQGNDPKYFKTVSTPKHYAVHSGPDVI